MKPQPVFQYFKVKLLSSDHRLQFMSLKDFIRFTEVNHHKTIFQLLDDKEEVTHFAVSDKAGLFQQTTEGFKTLEDYSDSVKHHFPDSVSYYESLAMGYEEYEDYQLVKEAGIDDKLVFEKIKQQGFMKGFAEYMNLKNAATALPDIGVIANPYQLYQFATKQGFTDYTEFKEAWKKGFTDPANYKVAVEKGYKSKEDFDAGSKAGFAMAIDYEKAKELNIRDREDFLRYNDLLFPGDNTLAHDQRVMIIMISKIEEKRKVSLNRIEELFTEALKEYRYEDSGEMAPWFTTAFTGKESMAAFLYKSDSAKKFGTFDKDGEYFETNRLQQRKVVIDGSNVAYNSQGGVVNKPRLMNIIRMVDYLKENGFTDILIINDHTLKRNLADGELMPKLNEKAECIEAPREKAADIFIIQYVKLHRCLLVSKDNFREWKVQDPWVAENIDYYRMTFVINKDSVLMPDLNKKT